MERNYINGSNCRLSIITQTQLMVKVLIVALLLATSLAFLIPASKKQLSLKPYDVAHSQQTAVYSSLAYCGNTCLKSWSCQDGKTVPPLSNVAYLTQNITQADGYVGYAESTNTIVVSFRGSSNIPNWIENLNFEKVPYIYCFRCEVHAGFMAAYVAIATQLNSKVKQILSAHPTASLLTTGHSLGGALAMIAALELKRLYNPSSVEIHSFGAPRIGDINFAKHVNNKIQNIYRVIHYKDLVPHLPPDLPKFDYHHSAYEIFWNQDFTSHKVCGDSGEDRSCSNQFFPEYSTEDHSLYFVKMSSPHC